LTLDIAIQSWHFSANTNMGEAVTGLEYMSILSLALLGAGAFESYGHRRRLKKIPIRIHVSGARGKSSVTRLIFAGLSFNGIKTVAKTTGTLPRILLPDGREAPVFRPSGANIIEQKRIIAAAVELGAEAVIIECMALQPELHWISENMLIKATHGVITNIRPDHLDVMGPGPEDVARSLAGMIPVGGKLFTAEETHLNILREAALDRRTELNAVSIAEKNAVTEAEMAGFSYVEHPENVALAIKALADFGINREDALRAMWKSVPDAGALTEHKLDFFGREIVFVNAFAANDPESTERIWRRCRAKYRNLKRSIVLLNLREDRASRTCQMAFDASFWKEADKVMLMGSGSYLFARLASQAGFPPSRFVYADQERIEEIFEQIVEICDGSALVVGVGNIGGQGLPLVRYFKNREILHGEKNE
jgi:poly-gamma-glutamate synthase PgsB/CapB